jgi:hypothetical protein
LPRIIPALSILWAYAHNGSSKKWVKNKKFAVRRSRGGFAGFAARVKMRAIAAACRKMAAIASSNCGFLAGMV